MKENPSDSSRSKDSNSNKDSQVTEENIKEILSGAKLDIDAEFLPPPICLKICQQSGEATIGTLGNFSMIIGKAKAKKTFFINSVIAAIVNNNKKINMLQGCLPPDQNKVLYFDTEQSRFHVHECYIRICKLAGINKPENLEVFCLRKFSPVDRLRLIEESIYSTQNLGLVVIDGIRDLITAINDEEQATMISSKLLRWSEELNIHIMVVLHQNKTDNNARGHVGTEIQNKAETVLSITKDESNRKISIVSSEYCRGIEPDQFAFEITSEGLPQILEDWELAATKHITQKGMYPSDISDEFHKELLQGVFENFPKQKHSHLIMQLKFAMKSRNRPFGDTKAKEFIQWYLDKKLIEKHGLDRSPHAYYTLPGHIPF